MRKLFALSTSILLIAISGIAGAIDFVTFETGPVRPMATNVAGSELYAVNIPDNRLEIFGVADNGLIATGSVQVGMEPCAVAVAPDGRVWVVNHLSDSVSIVDVTASPPQVVQTLLVGDEPRDIVFAGTVKTRAFITTAHRGQHRTNLSIFGVAGAGDPQLTTEGIPRADVWVFDASNPGSVVGGTPDKIMSFFADTPRALAVSPDQVTVYVAAFHSGNQTTSIPELIVCDGFDPGVPCLLGGILSVPGGLSGPDDNIFGASAPETGLIVKFDNATGTWKDSAGVDWSTQVIFDLPDRDVFAVNANTLFAGFADKYDHVGTTLFNMAVNPISGKVYVSNTESPNEVSFEGPGDHGGSTVQGHLSESRISVLSGTSTVEIRHLNKHIDYDKLHTDTPDLVDPTQIDHSLATPVEMVVTSDGATLYVAAFGSEKIGVFSTAALEADTFDPTVISSNYITVGGGPSGLVLDEARNRLYVMTRFDNSLNVVDIATKTTLQTVPLHNPEPQSVVDGRPILYDALHFSGNGEASCSSCHIFGDMDDLAWNLGDPDGAVSTNNQPAPAGSGASSFHPMKGPMTTQTLRGLATHGAMHWRGDRLDGFFGTDPCTEPTGAACDEEHSFNNFIVAFEGLVGMDGTPSGVEMQKFTDFILQVVPPPNPVRALNNSLNSAQAAGLAKMGVSGVDGGDSCDTCHVRDPLNGFFSTGGGQSFEGEPQNMKIPHLRNAYAKVGMFGMWVEPDATLGTPTGGQVRGFGFLHDGVVDTIANFTSAPVFTLTAAEEADIEQFVLAFDSDLAPITGQQVTLDSTNSGAVTPRITVLKARAAASFDSLILGGTVTECDLIVKGTQGGVPRGWLYRPGTADYTDDTGAIIADAALTALATSDGPLTFTCVPPGSGTRMAINRDRDTHLDGVDNCPDAANDPQTDTDADTQGDACDQDDDADTLLDVYETNSGTFVSAFDTGSDPLLLDTDGDGFDDGAEVLAGTDPNDPLDPVTATCGDGAIGGAETCDDGGTAPGDGCDSICAIETGWMCSGAPSVCSAICGDGLILGSETCDDSGTAPGDGCDAVCSIEPGWMCSGEPSSCSTSCGDGIIVGAETCDDGGTTPGDGCDAACTVEIGWSCSGEPSTCSTGCGDGIIAGAETCDDGGTTPGDGCDAVCTVETGWSCSGEPSTCSTTCGDGLIAGSETCDDGGTAPGDGCDSICAIETGWMCSGEPSACSAICGDGLIAGSETCDDSGTTPGDGCDAACTIESGWMCSGEPSACSTSCGDGIIAGAETCDDSGTAPGDGCDAACTIESGWLCSGEPSACSTTCGDGMIVASETCDDGGTAPGDGCDAVCAIESGWSCLGEPSACFQLLNVPGLSPVGMLALAAGLLGFGFAVRRRSRRA